MEIGDIVKKIRTSLTLKLIFIGILLLLLQIPVWMVDSLVADRMKAKKSAEADICRGWGGEQTVAGPFLVIPAEITVNAAKKTTRRDCIFQMPESLRMETVLTPQVRYRGIYKVVLYSAEVRIKAKFKYELPSSATCRPEKTRLCFGIADLIGIRKAEVKVNGKTVQIQSGLPETPGNGIHAVLPQTGNGGEFEVEAELVLNGSSSFKAAPWGQNTEIVMRSAWKDPSFSGTMLPAERKIGADGFDAKWLCSSLNRNFPQQWIGAEYQVHFPGRGSNTWSDKLIRTEVGVQLKLMTDIYTQVDRAMKYVTLFIIFIMLFFLIGEHLAGVWMHPFQYVLTGLAVVLFYLLLLSISEHVFFDYAYTIAAIGVTLLVACYTGAIFRSRRAALGEGAAMLGAYAVIYLLLKLENTALLVGSGVLFALLALLMALTSNLNKERQ